jgi:hypothetical protein
VQLLHPLRDNQAQEDAQRARQIRYYRECVIPALPGDPKTAPPSYRYFVDMVARLNKVRPEDLTENSVLLGSPQRIMDTLKKVEAPAFRGDPLFQRRAEAAPAGEGRDGSLHARGGARLRRRAQAERPLRRSTLASGDDAALTADGREFRDVEFERALSAASDGTANRETTP